MYAISSITRDPWSILDEMVSLQDDFNRTFGDGTPRRLRVRTAYPPMNVWSSEEGLIVDAELPGVDPNEVTITVKGGELTLSGKVVEEAPANSTAYRRERPCGEFSRMVRLPFTADANGVKAHYRNGVLRIAVPKSEAEKPRKIAVETR